MSNTAAHLMDHIIPPDVTLRQWVLTVPFELRLLLVAKPEALSAVGRIFVQEIQRWPQQRARALGFEQAEGAAVSFCQRFGSSLNLNIHWHVIVPDALFLPDVTGSHVDTLKPRAPTRLDLEEIVTTSPYAPWAGSTDTATSDHRVSQARTEARTPTRRGCAACKAASAWVSSSAGRNTAAPRSLQPEHTVVRAPSLLEASVHST